jgi:hypothetical protein
MTRPETFIETHPVLIGMIITPLVALLFPRFRAQLKRMLAWLFSGRQLLREVASDVKQIKQEVQFSNDTSTKQEVALLKKRSYLEFWRQNKPAIEMDGDAQVQHVSENLCFLMGVRTPADLYLRNWLRCVEAGRVDDFLSAFTMTVKFKSDFDFIFRIQTKDGHNQGEWKLMMSDVTPPGYSKTIYSGFFKPVDERAKEIAAEMHWSR